MIELKFDAIAACFVKRTRGRGGRFRRGLGVWVAVAMTSIVAVRSTLDLQCGFTGAPLPLSLKGASGNGRIVFLAQPANRRLKGLGVRMRLQRHAHSRDEQRRFALNHGLETSRADFSTSNEADLAAGDRSENFMERLTRAWAVLFPAKSKPSSNREIAKQRLKMILVSDRCSVNDEAKKKIVTNIVGALSDFVEIQSEEKVQIDVISDADLNTVCSVTVPVRRVRPEYQEFSRELVNAELRAFDFEEEEGSMRMVDIRFERPGVEDIQS
ncbi:hypothetical protein KC19_10G041200 [Ceratodon purpureus]|uniref:Uncharacterized protein n=1 Tax=Ceratodon purpureus TaxID=3225 RepID=A0A8T0GLJ7_CERPU|nr:hypothetical protein KC19_10G041200 [Ceratodon purpureus]